MIVSRLLAFAVLAGSLVAPAGVLAADCVPRGEWRAPGANGLRPLPLKDLFGDLAQRSVVLLGERHDSAEHHRWQLQVIAALHAMRPDMVIGLEMFPRRVQPVLDRWVAGELDEQAFLRASDWREVWNTDPQLYLPIFHFARMNRIPLVALNVDRKLTRAVREKGFDAIPGSEREGVGRPAAPSQAYLGYLRRVYGEHQRSAAQDEKAPGAPAPGTDEGDFRRFVDSQLLWDRAMAEGIASALKGTPAPLVVGVMGGGHIVNRYGVPHQLAALAVNDVAVLVPLDNDDECDRVVVGYADAVFGLREVPTVAAARRQRLGVWVEPDPAGVRIRRVEQGSVAEAAGIRAGDVVIEVAGVPAKASSDMVEAVQRQAPGTWLPLKVKRGTEAIEVVAKFPPLAP